MFLAVAPLAQVDRVPDFGSGGWGFESLRARIVKSRPGNYLRCRAFLLPRDRDVSSDVSFHHPSATS